jgi:hypothetical protein
MIRLLTLWITAGLLVLSAQSPQSVAEGAQRMANKVLTDADVDIYCTITAEIRKLIGPVRNAQNGARMAEISRTTTAKHGMPHVEYSILDARLNTVLSLLKMGIAQIPEKVKADYDLVVKHRTRIEAARAFPK